MQTENTTPLLHSGKNIISFISLGFLLVTLGATIALFFWNTILTKGIDTQGQAISALDQKITEIAKDRDVIITKILASNTLRPSIDVSQLVQAFRAAATKAHVRLKGFAVDKDTISTTLISTEGDMAMHPDAASTIIKMMRTYDTGGEYFLLDPITSLTGEPSRRITQIMFHIKNK